MMGGEVGLVLNSVAHILLLASINVEAWINFNILLGLTSVTSKRHYLIYEIVCFGLPTRSLHAELSLQAYAAADIVRSDIINRWGEVRVGGNPLIAKLAYYLSF